MTSNSENQAILSVILGEHDALRRTMDGLLAREVQLLSYLILITAGAIPIVLQINSIEDRVLALLLASLVFGGMAWAIEIQYWDIVWHQYYILTVLRPACLTIISNESFHESLLGWEKFTRTFSNKPRSMLGLIVVGGIFYSILVVLPSVISLAIAIAIQQSNSLPWSTLYVALALLSALSVLSLCIATLMGYYANNFSVRRHAHE